MNYRSMLMRIGRRRRRNVIGALFEMLDRQPPPRQIGAAQDSVNPSEGERRRQVQVDGV